MDYLLQANYLIFWLPASAAMLVILFMGFSGIGFDGVDADHDIDCDHDFDHDLDHDFGHDVDHDHDGHADHIDGEHNIVIRALSVLGMGRVPLSIVLTTFSMVWGVVGFSMNRVFDSMYVPDFLYFWAPMIVAFFAASFLTGLISRIIAKIMPKTETYAAKPASFIGKRGKVVYTVKEDSGMIRVLDDGSNIIDLEARVESGEDPIGSGRAIVVTSFRQETGDYVVARHSFS